MNTKTNLITLALWFLSLGVCVAGSYVREHKLNDRITIFSEDDGKYWGAKLDGEVILEPDYAGIDLLGENYLKLIKYDNVTNKVVYGSADLSGSVQLVCEYEHIAIQQGRLQAFRPPVIVEDKSIMKPKENVLEVAKKEEAPSAKHREDVSTQGELFSSEPPKYVVEFIQGETENPKIDLGIIRNKIETNNEPKTEVDKMPSFPGGEEKMHQFIKDNLEFPENAKVLGIQGRVVVRFVVKPNGNTEEVEVLHGLETSCDKEAVRIVELMPRWNPGSQNGKKVPVYFTLPISFFF